jgi:hypothetical protein
MNKLREKHHKAKLEKKADALATSTDTTAWDKFEAWLGSSEGKKYSTLPQPVVMLRSPMRYQKRGPARTNVKLNATQALALLQLCNDADPSKIAVGDVRIKWNNGGSWPPQMKIQTANHGKLTLSAGKHFSQPYLIPELRGIDLSTPHEIGFVTTTTHANMILGLPKKYEAFDRDHNPQRALTAKVPYYTPARVFYEMATFPLTDRAGKPIELSYTIHNAHVAYVVTCNPKALDRDDVARMATTLKATESQAKILNGRDKAEALRKKKAADAKAKGLAAAAAKPEDAVDKLTEAQVKQMLKWMMAGGAPPS